MLFVVKTADGFEYYEDIDKPCPKATQAMAIAAVLAWPNRPYGECTALIPLKIAHVQAEHGKLVSTQEFDYDIHPVEIPDDVLTFQRDLKTILQDIPAALRPQFTEHFELLRQTGIPAVTVLARATRFSAEFLRLWTERELFTPKRLSWLEWVCGWWSAWQQVADRESGHNPAEFGHTGNDTPGYDPETGWPLLPESGRNPDKPGQQPLSGGR